MRALPCSGLLPICIGAPPELTIDKSFWEVLPRLPRQRIVALPIQVESQIFPASPVIHHILHRPAFAFSILAREVFRSRLRMVRIFRSFRKCRGSPSDAVVIHTADHISTLDDERAGSEVEN